MTLIFPPLINDPFNVNHRLSTYQRYFNLI